jgi:tetratricopeptide (TPR) repeat protein
VSRTVDALLREGRRLFDAGLAADARDLLGRAHAMAPEHETCARWLADAQLTDGALDEASDTLAAALGRAPASPELVVLQSEVALRRGALGAAEAILDAAIATSGTSATLLARRGYVHLLAGNYRAASELVERSLTLDPHNSAAHSTLILAASYDPSMTTARLKQRQRRWIGPQTPAPVPTFDIADSATARPLRRH